MKTQRKGQAALEFLMTYGWAFLVILIMIGALTYFGVLNVNAILPDKCNFGKLFSCKNDQYGIWPTYDSNVVGTATVNDNATVIATLSNTYGANIVVTNFQVFTESEAVCTDYFVAIENATKNGMYDANEAVVGDTVGGAGTTFNWRAGRPYQIMISCDNTGDGLPVGEKARFTIDFDWYPVSSGTKYLKTSQGVIFAEVSPS